jgi:selenocysteine-specific elongation factor
LSQVEGNVILGQLLDTDQVRQVDNLYITSFSWERFLERAVLIIESYHSKTPLRIGMPREELRSRLGVASSPFNILLIDLVNLNSIELIGKTVKLTEHKITFSAKENQKIEELMAKFSELGVNSPSVKIAKSYIGEDVYSALIDLGDLKAIAPDVVYRSEDYRHYIQLVTDHLKENERISAGELRDLLKTSRKYAIAMLEHLDDKGVTRRVGDERYLVNLPGEV